MISGDLQVTGALRAGTLSLPANAVTDTTVLAAAGISASKLQHQYSKTYANASLTTVATERRVLHYVYGATGTLLAFRCGTVVLNIGAATVSVQLKKNGSNILSSATVLDTGNTVYIVENEAGFTSSSIVAGDVLEVDITATAGGGTLATGFFCALILREDAQ
jgi:hypothetical protein